jgi:hypothetical protein
MLLPIPLPLPLRRIHRSTRRVAEEKITAMAELTITKSTTATSPTGTAATLGTLSAG